MPCAGALMQSDASCVDSHIFFSFLPPPLPMHCPGMHDMTGMHSASSLWGIYCKGGSRAIKVVEEKEPPPPCFFSSSIFLPHSVRTDKSSRRMRCRVKPCLMPSVYMAVVWSHADHCHRYYGQQPNGGVVHIIHIIHLFACIFHNLAV